MSSVAQFQFIEFILLLVLTHLTIKMIVPKLDSIKFTHISPNLLSKKNKPVPGS